MLQSKRLLLASARRRFGNGASPALEARLAGLDDDVHAANVNYRRAILDWALPESNEFWLMVYSSLIEHVEQLTEKVISASSELPELDRIDMLSDAAIFDRLVERWRASLSAVIAEDAA